MNSTMDVLSNPIDQFSNHTQKVNEILINCALHTLIKWFQWWVKRANRIFIHAHRTHTLTRTDRQARAHSHAHWTIDSFLRLKKNGAIVGTVQWFWNMIFPNFAISEYLQNVCVCVWMFELQNLCVVYGVCVCVCLWCSCSIRLTYIVCSFGVNTIRVQRQLKCSLYSIFKAHSGTHAHAHTQHKTMHIRICMYVSYGMCTHSPIPIPIPIPIEFCHSDINGNADLLFTFFHLPLLCINKLKSKSAAWLFLSFFFLCSFLVLQNCHRLHIILLRPVVRKTFWKTKQTEKDVRRPTKNLQNKTKKPK